MGLQNWDKTALSTLAEYLCQTRYEDLTQEAIVAARIRLLDYLGTAIHASRARPWLPVYDLYRSFHLEDGLPKSPLFEEATVIGGDVKLPCGWAAMVNTYPHMSEGSRMAGGHNAWVVMPAVLAMAERERSSGKSMILAIVLAYEIMLRVGQAIYPMVHEKGFQPTTARGPLGSAAVACKLMGLDQTTTAHALSIAAAMGGGLEAAAFPYPLYCFQTGRATESGILAAQAASRGLCGNPGLFEEGFLPTFGKPGCGGEILKSLNHSQYAITDTYIKIHFGCRHAHSPVDACLDVMREHRLTWEDIASIEVETYPIALNLCNRPGAKTPADAIYDMPAIIGLAVVFGDAAMSRFGYLEDRRVKQIVDGITIKSNLKLQESFPKKWPARVKIRTRTNQIHQGARDLPRGEPEEPIGQHEVEQKFHQLAKAGMPESGRTELIDLINNLEQNPNPCRLYDILKKKSEA